VLVRCRLRRAEQTTAQPDEEAAGDCDADQRRPVRVRTAAVSEDRVDDHECPVGSFDKQRDPDATSEPPVRAAAKKKDGRCDNRHQDEDRSEQGGWYLPGARGPTPVESAGRTGASAQERLPLLPQSGSASFRRRTRAPGRSGAGSTWSRPHES
jgi:hypothetical protein